jgi:alkylation response protein AidB-like acyl-CoA dehydrogenase
MQLQNNSVFNEPEKFLNSVEKFFQESVAPQAEKIDRNSNSLKATLKAMGDRNLLALRVPKKWGGAELDETTFERFQMLSARASGTLAFLQTQHQSAGNLIATSANEFLKQAYLPHLASGRVLVGVGFSQLRRQGEPLTKATPIAKGYHLNGEVPWITGFNFFQEFIIGATLPNGDAIYGIVPFREACSAGGSIHFSAPMQLTAMAATNTVSAKLNNWLLERDRVININPSSAIAHKDRKNVLHHGFFALGCARAGLDIVESAYRRKNLSFVKQAFETLNRELTSCSEAMFEALNSQERSFEQKLPLRAWAINIAGKCSQAAIAVSSGAANSIQHPAQRVYREALMFAVFGQTTAVMEATLERLLVQK